MGANLLHLTQFASMAPAQFFISSIWQGLLLTTLAWFALKAAPLAGIRISPGTRFVLWMIVFVLSAVLPFSALLHSRSAAAGLHEASAVFPSPHLPAVWAVAMVGVWALASLFSMGRLLWNIYRLDMLARTSTPLPEESLSSELRTLLKNSTCNKSISQPVEICLSDRIDSPVVIGFFRPAVVIPRWLWRKLTQSELNQIVMHELAHLERCDDWTNLLQKFLRALFPLNPALLLAERQLCWEREMACDDAVLNAAVSPKEYATCLTNLAERRLLRRAQSLAPGAWRRRSELAERVHRILQHKGALRPLHSRVHGHSRAVIGAFIAVYLCAGLALARCPRLVAFTATEGSSPAPVMEARSLSLHRHPRVVQADLHTDGIHEQSLPRVIDATFRAPAGISQTFTPRVSSAQAGSKRLIASRGKLQHRAAARASRPNLTQIRFAQRWLANAQLAQERLTQTRLMFNAGDSPQPAPAAIAQALFAQALFIQAAEQAAEWMGADSSAQLVLYLSPSPATRAPTPGTRSDGVSISSRSPESHLESHLDSGWIVIQL